MKKYRSSSLALGACMVSLFVTIGSCVNHEFEPTKIDVFDCSSTTNVSFVNDIAPIIASNCAISGCHNGSMGPDLDWRVFTTFQSNASDVRDRVTRPAGAAGHMPKVGSITDSQIRLLVCWVDQGAKDN